MLQTLNVRKALAFRVALLCLLLTSLLASNTNECRAQVLPRVISPSPEASTLFRFMDYPVNHSTGVPEISVPIYEIKSGEIKVPISLSYHAGGRRVKDETGAVGLGWSLNAGGMISRTIYGRPDDISYFPYTLKSASNMTNLDDYSYLSSLFKDDAGSGNIYDSEFDIFSYQFGGQSGKFIYSSQRDSIYLLPHKPLKIPVGGFPSTIIDDKGHTYNFSQIESIQNVSYYNAAVTSKLLTQIISANKKDTVSFIYQNFLKQGGYPTGSHTLIDFKYTQLSVTPYSYASNTQQDRYSINRLKEIKFREGKVVFNMVSNSDRVSNIQIIRKDGKILKTIQLQMSILDNSGSSGLVTGGSTISWLSNYKLDYLIFQDNNPTGVQNIEKYSFEYNPSTDFSQLSRDYWGYRNSSTSGTIVPYYTNITIYQPYGSGVATTNVSSSSANRNSDEAMMQGVLKKIIYPTGGSTEFIFEVNRINATTKCGGLRVKEIKTTDNFGNVTFKTYCYGVNESGYGVLPITPSSVQMEDMSYETIYLPTTYVLRYASGGDFANAAYRKRIYTSEFLPGVSELANEPIFYSEVTEYAGTVASNTGKIVYKYDIPLNGASNNYANYFPAPSYPSASSYPTGYNYSFDPNLNGGFNYPVDPSLGRLHIAQYNLWNHNPLIEKTEYKNSGNNTYQRVKKTDYGYQSTVTNTLKGLHLYKYLEVDSYTPHSFSTSNEEFVADILGLPVFVFADYEMKVGKKEFIGTTETLFTDAGQLANTITYSYNNKHLVSETRRYTSTGEVFSSKNIYPFDLPSETPHQEMINRNMLNYVVEQHEYKNTTPLQSVKTTYKSWGNYLIAPEVVSTRQGTSAYELRQRYHAYDSRGNVQSISKEKDYKLSYLWGYNKAYPIAEVKNAQNELVITSVPATSSKTITYIPNNYQNQYVTFTTTAAGTIDLNTGFGGSPGSSTAKAEMDYTLSGPSNRSGSLTLCASPPCMSYPSAVSLTNMPAGTYTLTIIMKSNTSTTANVYIGCSYPGTQIGTSGTIEFYYEGFEDDNQASTARAHTGRKCNSGRNFLVNFSKPNTRNYIISWRQWDGSKWIYKQENYTGSKQFDAALSVDDIRVLPSDAQMTTYTYDPLVGMTSSTDANNITTYYTYDAYGRLSLIKDQNGLIRKKYTYQYANQ